MIERLYRGSVINYHTFFQKDYNGEVYLRFSQKSILKILTLEKMKSICNQFPTLKKTFENFQLLTARLDKTLPLDYIMALPNKVKTKLYEKTTMLLKEEKAEEIQDMV